MDPPGDDADDGDRGEMTSRIPEEGPRIISGDLSPAFNGKDPSGPIATVVKRWKGQAD